MTKIGCSTSRLVPFLSPMRSKYAKSESRRDRNFIVSIPWTRVFARLSVTIMRYIVRNRFDTRFSNF